MTTVHRCDQCDKVFDGSPWRVNYPVEEVDEDGDPDWWDDDADLCGPACLASWAMTHALDTADS